MKVPLTYPSLHYACSRLARTFRQSEGLFSPHFPSSCRFTGSVGSKSLGRLVRLCLLIADIGMNGHASVTAAVFAVGCIHQTRRFGIQD
ncbi:hypothetical protein N9219_05315 [bacterium]|nr:hypothetical protein [bacterium]